MSWILLMDKALGEYTRHTKQSLNVPQHPICIVISMAISIYLPA